MTFSAARKIHHIDIVVRDLERATERYRLVLGIDPLPRERLEERGVDLVRFRVGQTWLILVKPTRVDSPVARFLDQHGEGFFHMALEVEDVESNARELARNGVRLVQDRPRTGVDGWQLIDLELEDTFGAMMQLVEAPEV